MFRVDVDIINYLVGNTVAPDSVISVPFNNQQIFAGAIPDFSEASQDVLASISLVSNVPNTKWLRDRAVISITTMGRGRGQYVEAETLLYDIFNTLLGSNNIEMDDHILFQFGSSSGPRFMGYQDNSKPVFDATISLYVDGIVDKFNRKTIY